MWHLFVTENFLGVVPSCLLPFFPLKVIPLKLFYYQTFFETWRNENLWYEHYKNAIKKWGHRACLRVSRLLKWGIFTGCNCALKVRITVKRIKFWYLKGTKFCLESKASFIDISSIASFKPFLIAWLREYCTFLDSSVVNLKSSPWPKYTQLGTIFQKKNHILLSYFFPLQICSRNYLKNHHHSQSCEWERRYSSGQNGRDGTPSFLGYTKLCKFTCHKISQAFISRPSTIRYLTNHIVIPILLSQKAMERILFSDLNARNPAVRRLSQSSPTWFIHGNISEYKSSC